MPTVTYKVLYPVQGFPAGKLVTSDDLSGLNVSALEEGGFLEVKSVEKQQCPSCAERNARGKTKTYTALQLADHYRKEHPGLVPPQEGEE
jgi:hypothetical protein